jgi:hypothetical protein
VSTAVRRSIYGKLAGDTTLNALLGTAPTGYSKSIFYQQAPANAAFPFVIFAKQAGIPAEAFTDPSAYETDTWLVKAVDRAEGADTAESISARCVTLLNDAALSVSGATLLYLRRQSDLDYSELDEGVRYVHVGSLFRLVTTD